MAIVYPSYSTGPDPNGMLDAFGQSFGFFRGLRDEKRDKEAFNKFADSMGQQQPMSLASLGQAQRAPAAPDDYASQRVSQAAGDAPNPMNSYFAAIRSAESGGNDGAKNPNSSATGRYQFTEGTWADLMQNNPQLGLTPEGRMDPQQQERAIRAFTGHNARALSQAGVGVNPANLYAAHFLGAGGATKALSAPDETAMAALVGPEVVQANPFLANMTVGDFRNWTGEKTGYSPRGAQGGAGQALNAMAEGGTQVADASGQAGYPHQQLPALPDPETMKALFASPGTRPLAIALAKGRIEAQQGAGDPMKAIQYQKALLELEKLRQGEAASLVNAGDGNLYDPNTGQWITAPGGGTRKAPTVVELFDEATGQPYKATWNPETGQYDRVGGVKARSGMSLTTNPDGTVTLTEGAIDGMPKLTESEGRNTGFYGRSTASHKLLNDLESEGTSFWNKTVGNVPVAGNYMRSENAQKYDQAKRDFINAVLRRESGAVISPEEFANAEQQYFPQPGDGEGVIKQKRANRETTIQGLKVSSGQGANFALPPKQGAAPGGTINYKDRYGLD